MRAEIETLDCGMEAVFVHQKTQSDVTSARLVFNTGALHETDPIIPGTAHFLEHVAILTGTQSYPNSRKLINAAARYDISFGGYTDWTNTWIEMQGLDAKFVTALILEMGFMPRLTRAGVEQDRTAIIEEARGYHHSATSSSVESLFGLFTGNHPSSIPSGTMDDIARIQHGDIAKFHREQWTPQNARLYVVSKQNPSRLRNYANSFLDGIPTNSSVGNPVILDLPWLKGREDVVINSDTDPHRQSEIVVAYPLKVPENFHDSVLEVASVDLIRRALWNQIRFNRNITYHAWAESFGVSSNNHGAKESYNSLLIESAIRQDRTQLFLEGLDRLKDDVLKLRLLGGSVLREYVYWLEGKGLYSHDEVAEDLLVSEQLGYQKIYDPDEEIKVVKGLTVRSVLKHAQSMLQGERVVHITRPGQLNSLDTVAAGRRLKKRR
jgi:predicted Zn-dependent peptidase